MPDRLSYSLWMDLEFKNFSRFKRHLLVLFYLKKDVWNERPFIFKDTISTPLNKKIGCKITNHNWNYQSDDDFFYCNKCCKTQSSTTRKVNQRHEIINKILKR
jgi:hypothetical protein